MNLQALVTSFLGSGWEPYRRGSVLRLFFERATDDSVLLFNHRNKLPGSEKRIESIGVRNTNQATLLVDRAYNKLRYQTTTSQATCLPEADLLVLRERVLWADNTRAGSMDGYVKGVQGLELHLSQELPWEDEATYTLFLQGKDRVVESIPVTRGQSARHAVLAHAPHVPVPDPMSITFEISTAPASPATGSLGYTANRAGNVFAYSLSLTRYATSFDPEIKAADVAKVTVNIRNDARAVVTGTSTTACKFVVNASSRSQPEMPPVEFAIGLRWNSASYIDPKSIDVTDAPGMNLWCDGWPGRSGVDELRGKSVRTQHVGSSRVEWS